MTVLQPLYYSAGRYTASTDRKLLASIIGHESSGTRMTGVFPPATNMATTIAAGTRNVTVSPGLCVIADQTTQSASSLGMYLCAIDSAGETVQLDTNTTGANRLDLIYAEVDETAYTVVNKELDGATDIATLTLSASTPLPSKVIAGQTVVVSGVDSTFDGSYIILTKPSSTTITYTRNADTIASDAVTATAESAGQIVDITDYAVSSNTVTITTATQSPQFVVQDTVIVSGINAVLDGIYQVASTTGVTHFTYKRITANVSSTAITTSAGAQIRIPFAIRSVTGNSATVAPSLPASTKSIALAQALINTSDVITSVPDARQYVAAPGGIVLYDSATVATAPAAAAGRMRFDTATGKLDFYDGANFKTIYTTAGGFDNTHNHDTRYNPAGLSAAGVLALPKSTGSTSTGITANSNPSTYAALSSNISISYVLHEACYVMLQFSAWLDVDATSVYGRLGVQVTGATTIAALGSATATDGSAAYYGDIGYINNTAAAGVDRQVNVSRLVRLNAGTNTIQLVGHRGATSGNFYVKYPVLRVIPLYKA